MKRLHIFKKSYFLNFVKSALTVLISVLVIYGVVQAGSLTPPVGAPSAQFYTLSNIYTRLTTNGTATEGDHSFTFADSLAGGGYTLTQIYDAIPTIDPTKLLDTTTYLGITGSIATQTLSSSSATVSAGYYAATNLSTVDTDLIAGNIKSGTNLFGIDGNVSAGYTYGDNTADYVLGTATAPGTALVNVYNGTASSGDYPQSVGGVDDYNNGGSMPSDTYNKGWTACVVGNNYCGTGDATYADMKDNSTGLVWSKYLGSGASYSWFTANNCLYPNGLPSDDGVCNTSGEVACKCVKLTGVAGNGAKTGCESIGDEGWRLPYHKELAQAYVNGAKGNLSTTTFLFWSATTGSANTNAAWNVHLGHAATSTNSKTTVGSPRTRCVR